MQIAQVIGGYRLGGADLLRRAMGKKKPEEMAQHRDIFVDGRGEERPVASARRRALRPDGEVRGLRLQQVARRRLRAGRLPDRVHEGAPRRGVHGGQHVGGHGRHRQGAAVPRGRASRTASTMLPPDVNAARLPLRAGRRASRSATAWARSRAPARRRSRHRRGARKAGPFTDLFDFCQRVDKRIVNRRVVESLVRAGAFDALDDHRASLLASVGIALESAEQASARPPGEPVRRGARSRVAATLAYVDAARGRSAADARTRRSSRWAITCRRTCSPAYERELRGFSRRRSTSSRRRPIPCCSPGIMHARASR